MLNDPSVPSGPAADLDEVLSLLPLLGPLPDLADRVFSRLTDGLVEAVLADIRARHERGELTRADYLTELCGVVVELQARGLIEETPGLR